MGGFETKTGDAQNLWFPTSPCRCLKSHITETAIKMFFGLLLFLQVLLDFVVADEVDVLCCVLVAALRGQDPRSIPP